MTTKEKELLNCIIGMRNQYCGEHGHCSMSAGEEAESIFQEYGIIKKDNFLGYIEEIPVEDNEFT